MPNIKLLQGNEAICEGAIYAGCRFYAGYPITPSNECAEIMSRRLPTVGGVYIQMEDELASVGAIIGASLAGCKAMTATSGPGFSLMQENLGMAIMGEIPIVIVNVMRGGPSTGYPTGPSQSDVMQTRWGTHGDHPIISVAPNSVSECITKTIRAFNLAEKYRTPVIILSDEIIAHMREKVEVPKEGEIEIISNRTTEIPSENYKPFEYLNGMPPPLPPYGTGYRFHITGLNHDITGFPTNNGELIQEQELRFMRKIYNHIDDILEYETFEIEDAEVIIVSFGSSSRSAKSAVKRLRADNIKAGLLRLITVWPFPERFVRKLSKKADLFVVPEMNLGQLIFEVERCIEGKKVIGVNKINSDPITPYEIEKRVKDFISGKNTLKLEWLQEQYTEV